MREIFFNKEARAKMLEGVNDAANAIGSTLGPRGKTVIIDPGNGNPPIMSKDGVTVASLLDSKDNLKKTGIMLIRQASEASVKDCGDGTTTASVLCQSMINAGVEAVNNGANSQEIKSGIEKAVICVVDALKAMAIPLTDNDMIKSIGTVSSNNDEEIGGKLAEAYGKIGNKGMLTIEMSKTHDTFVTIMEGAEMQRGYSNEGFVTNPAKMTVEYDNPKILVLNYEVKSLKQLEPFLKEYQMLHKLDVTPLVIIAREYEGEFHNSTLVNKKQYGAKICLIQAPNMYQREAFDDMATITGATLITDDAGMKLESANCTHLGTCKKIIVSRFNTLVVEGGGDKLEVEALKKKINAGIEFAKEDAVKEVSEKRLARLSGSIGVIYVGGNTHVEQVERLHRVDDANKAIKSAIEEGIVAGGGIALIMAKHNLNQLNLSKEEDVGVQIIYSACEDPILKMLSNAGVYKKRKTLLSKIWETFFGKNHLIINELNKCRGNKGYNVKTGEFVDMIEAKIIDPVKVVRCALQNAASVAGQVINSDVMLVEMA